MLGREPRPRAFDKRVPLAPGRALAVAVAGARGRALARALEGVGDVIVVESDEPLANAGGLVDARALDAPLDAAGALEAAKGSLFLAQRARPHLLEAARAGGAFYVVVTALADAHPVTGAVHGLLKTAALEWPEVACATVDVGHGLDAGLVVADELRSGFLDLEVERTDAGRFVPALVERPLAHAQRAAPPSSPLPGAHGEVIVASGGARGVTATALLALARASRPALLLLGRTALVDEPACCAGAGDEASLKRALVADKKRAGLALSLAAVGEEARAVVAVREIRAFLASLESAGARVLYRAVDVRDAVAVAAACADARAAFGPITGLVHGAGVLADRRIEDKTAEQVARVMDTKVLGLEALLAATRDDPLRVVALFSSVAGRFGNVGQVDYAMANEALNETAVALARTRPGLVVKSLNWGPWEGGMVTPALKKIFLERGVHVLSRAAGARHFVDELSARDGAVEVVFGGALSGQTAAGAPAVSRAVNRVRVDARAFPFLADHAIQGTVVLPVAGALALAADAAGATSFTDVRVLRGLRLPRFFDEGHDVDVVVDGERFSLSVPGERGPRYTARVVRSHGAPPAAPSALTAATGARPAGGEPVYARLFHGPRFHLLQSVDRIDDDVLVARARGCVDAGWGEALALDAGALDAALQAALLWARHRSGGAFLPTAIAAVTASTPAAGRGPLACVVRGARCDGVKAVADVTLTRADGTVAAALTGVELHRLPRDDAFASGARP